MFLFFLFLFEKQIPILVTKKRWIPRSLVIVISTPSSSSSSSACLCLANKLIAAPLVPLCQPSGKEGDKSPASTIDAFAHHTRCECNTEKEYMERLDTRYNDNNKAPKRDDWDNLCRPSIHHLSPSPRSSKRIILLIFFFLFVYLLSAFFVLVCDEDANNPGGENTDRGSYPDDFGGREGMLLRCDGLLRQSAHWLIVIIFSVSLFCVCVCVFAISSRRVFGKKSMSRIDGEILSLSLLSFALTDWVTGLVVIPRTYRTQNLSWPADVRIGNIY